MGFLPKTVDFFEIFDKAASNLTKCASTLVSLMENIDQLEVKSKEIYELEQEGDILTHEVMKKLNKTFLTPIDREDLHALAAMLDDVLDLIWGAVDRMTVYKIRETTPEAISLSKNLLETTEVIQKAIEKLHKKNYSHMQDYCIEINRLENMVDRIFRDGLGKLFEDFTDPMLVMKWKDVYQHLEDASDKCEDVANILESIALKHA